MFEVKVNISIGASDELVSVLSKIADSLCSAKCIPVVDNTPSRKVEADGAEVVEVVSDENENENSHMTLKELRSIANGAIKQGKRDAVSALLKEFGVSNVSLIRDDQRMKFAEKVKSLS